MQRSKPREAVQSLPGVGSRGNPEAGVRSPSRRRTRRGACAARGGAGGAARPPERWRRRGFGLRLVGGRGGRRGPGQEDQRLEPGRSPRLGDSAAALQLRGSGARPGGTRTAGQPGAGAAGRGASGRGVGGQVGLGTGGPGAHGTGLGMPPAGRGAHPDTPRAGCGRRGGCHGNLQHSGSVAVASSEICPALRTRQSAHPAPRPEGAGSGTRDAAPRAGRRLPGASRADLATPDAEGLLVFQVSTNIPGKNKRAARCGKPAVHPRSSAPRCRPPGPCQHFWHLCIFCFFLALLVNELRPETFAGSCDPLLKANHESVGHRRLKHSKCQR